MTPECPKLKLAKQMYQKEATSALTKQLLHSQYNRVCTRPCLCCKLGCIAKLHHCCDACSRDQLHDSRSNNIDEGNKDNAVKAGQIHG